MEVEMPELATDYDVVMVGSGFGGSVTALRLTEKGYRDPEHGVIEPYHRVYGYPTLSVIDGAAVSANLGVNPSLTIALKPSARQRCGPTKARATSEPSKGRHTTDRAEQPRRAGRRAGRIATPACRDLARSPGGCAQLVNVMTRVGHFGRFCREIKRPWAFG
jgi:hypothetical protein